MEGGKGCRHVVVSSVFPSLVVVPTYSLKFMFLLKKKKRNEIRSGIDENSCLFPIQYLGSQVTRK